MKIEIQNNVDVTIAKRFSFSEETHVLIAEVLAEDTRRAVFVSIDNTPITADNIGEKIFLAAGNHLNNLEYLTFVKIDGQSENPLFPVYENIQDLPELEDHVKLECEISRYDGPISGFVSSDGRLFWFDWCMEEVGTSGDFYQRARIFYGREILGADIPFCYEWIKNYEILSDEGAIISNPQHYPLFPKQKEIMRSQDDMQADFNVHDKKIKFIKRLPISVQFEEPGPEFAAIQMVEVSRNVSEQHEIWQVEVACALYTQDQAALDRLFSSPPIPCKPTDIFWVKRMNDEGNEDNHVCDYQGKPLSDDYMMSGNNCVIEFTHLLKKMKAMWNNFDEKCFIDRVCSFSYKSCFGIIRSWCGPRTGLEKFS